MTLIHASAHAYTSSVSHQDSGSWDRDIKPYDNFIEENGNGTVGGVPFREHVLCELPVARKA